MDEDRATVARAWIEVVYCPLDRLVLHLAQGWRVPGLVVEPMIGHHGAYAILLERP